MDQMPPSLPKSRTEPDGSAVIRVLSYNIRSLRDDEEALARVIRACEPDLVLVQEAPRFFRWRKHAARLAAKCDLVVLGGGATAAGPLLLCSLRVFVERAEDVLLPRTPDCTAGASPRRWSGSGACGWGWPPCTCRSRRRSAGPTRNCCWNGWPAWTCRTRSPRAT